MVALQMAAFRYWQTHKIVWIYLGLCLPVLLVFVLIEMWRIF